MSQPDPTPTTTARWERHHREIVQAAAAGDASRAGMLLRDHLDGVGCDPIAVRAVVDALQLVGDDEGLEALVARLPACPVCAAGWSAPIGQAAAPRAVGISNQTTLPGSARSHPDRDDIASTIGRP